MVQSPIGEEQMSKYDIKGKNKCRFHIRRTLLACLLIKKMSQTKPQLDSFSILCFQTFDRLIETGYNFLLLIAFLFYSPSPSQIPHYIIFGE